MNAFTINCKQSAFSAKISCNFEKSVFFIVPSFLQLILLIERYEIKDAKKFGEIQNFRKCDKRI